LSPFEISVLIAGGLAAGVINTLAGGGSLITVPLLVLIGLPGTVANGTNRVGITLQSLVSVWRFEAEGVSELRRAVPLLVPIVIGSVTGAAVAARIPDAVFERVFAVVMLLLLYPMLRGVGASKPDVEPRLWSRGVTMTVFFAIGVYGGAIQAGVGIVLLFALSHAGFDLVRANALKMVVVSALAVVALPVFILEDRIAWVPALVLSVGFVIGAALGTRLAVRNGERIIRPALTISVVALAGRLLGLY
jgi:hypothetical protein